jgi:hypothetical protein
MMEIPMKQVKSFFLALAIATACYYPAANAGDEKSSNATSTNNNGKQQLTEANHPDVKIVPCPSCSCAKSGSSNVPSSSNGPC